MPCKAAWPCVSVPTMTEKRTFVLYKVVEILKLGTGSHKIRKWEVSLTAYQVAKEHPASSVFMHI